MVATPEEQVRQNLLRIMVEELGYPKGLISVERKIAFRRYDIVCYSTAMKPLLLIECKAEDPDEGAIDQALGYNFWLQAPFIGLAGPRKILTLWKEEEKWGSVPFLPRYEELCRFSERS